MFRQSINQRSFYYSSLTGQQPLIDDTTGLPSGETSRTFSTPTQTWGNISSAAGRMRDDVFGWNIDYDLTIVLADSTLAIPEGAKLWIYASTALPNDYEVVAVGKTLNETVIAAKHVP